KSSCAFWRGSFFRTGLVFGLPTCAKRVKSAPDGGCGAAGDRQFESAQQLPKSSCAFWRGSFFRTGLVFGLPTCAKHVKSAPDGGCGAAGDRQFESAQQLQKERHAILRVVLFGMRIF
ncbi:MAG: hypothetical protein IKD96_06160, partial [Oscillospiraceae bacterium]|nr:hypothetical protein [Oscillospiraceae bacterium]